MPDDLLPTTVTHASRPTVGTVGRIEAAKSAPAWATVMQIIEAMGVPLPDLAQTVEKARRRI
jgi:hypothetical protein